LWLQVAFGTFKSFAVYMQHIKGKMFPVLLFLLISDVFIKPQQQRGVLGCICTVAPGGGEYNSQKSFVQNSRDVYRYR
jgi:hypothetical protein